MMMGRDIGIASVGPERLGGVRVGDQRRGHDVVWAGGIGFEVVYVLSTGVDQTGEVHGPKASRARRAAFPKAEGGSRRASVVSSE